MPGNAHVRATAAGVFTGALAVAAHGLANGGTPTGGSMALLMVLSAALSGVTGSWARTSSLANLLIVLGGGQILGHLALSAGGHLHDGATSAVLPSPMMLAAHVTAIAIGAVLIQGCEHLWAALSSVLQVRAYLDCTSPDAAPTARRVRADQPPRRLQLIAVSISRRGPPVSAAR